MAVGPLSQRGVFFAISGDTDFSHQPNQGIFGHNVVSVAVPGTMGE